MYKIQQKTKNGWQDVRDLRRSNRPIVFFNTPEEAVRWRIKIMGVGSSHWTRIVDTEKMTVIA